MYLLLQTRRVQTMLKKNKLRYNEYYDMQHIYDELYAQSKNGNNFYKLLEIIGSEQNICLAYRNLKSNSGSKTAGTDGMTIDDIKQLSNAEIVATVGKALATTAPNQSDVFSFQKLGAIKCVHWGFRVSGTGWYNNVSCKS